MREGGACEKMWLDAEIGILSAMAADPSDRVHDEDETLVPRSFPLIVNCSLRRDGWKRVGEELLKRNPASMRVANHAGVTALAAACSNGHSDVVEWCISNNADVDTGNGHGVTPMALASARGYLSVVKALISAGADIGRGNLLENDSPVHIACWENNHEIVRFLGTTAQSRPEQAGILTSRNFDGITPLEVACMRGNLESVQVLRKFEVPMDDPNEHGDTPLLSKFIIYAQQYLD